MQLHNLKPFIRVPQTLYDGRVSTRMKLLAIAVSFGSFRVKYHQDAIARSGLTIPDQPLGIGSVPAPSCQAGQAGQTVLEDHFQARQFSIRRARTWRSVTVPRHLLVPRVDTSRPCPALSMSSSDFCDADHGRQAILTFSFQYQTFIPTPSISSFPNPQTLPRARMTTEASLLEFVTDRNSTRIAVS
jgi:hypothetical protein